MGPREQQSPAAIRAVGYFTRALALIVIDGLALWLLAWALRGIEIPSIGAGITTAAAIALLNALLWPILTRVLLPLTVLTFGLFSLALNVFVIDVAFELVDGYDPRVGAALITGICLAALTALVAPLLNFDGDAYHLLVVRRRVRTNRKRNRSDIPGVIMFEVDGLSAPVLEHAIQNGHAPTIARWLNEGSHRLVPWECDLSSQTGASQAGLLQGSNDNMPAFRWYEKDHHKMMVSNHPKDAAEIERRHATGDGLLADNGTSRGNMFSGDAPRCSATMSAIRDRQRSRSHEYYGYFSDPYGLMRTIALSIADVIGERRAARRQRKSGAEHVDRGGLYPFVRAAIAVVMRDLNVATLMADVVEGVPVSYSTFVGYDEVAHHSGVREPDAFSVLKRHDAQLKRLERAAQQAPRPYHFVVLSDHGQTQGRPFRQRHGETLEELVRRLVADGSVHAPPAIDEAWGDLGAVLAEAREHPTVAGRLLNRATSDRMADGTVALGPNRDAVREQVELERGGDPQTIVMASGCLGLVYFPQQPGRVSAEEIERAHPGLLAGLASHPGIGFVMVRSDLEGAVVLGDAGRRRLADDGIDGDDPLIGYGARAADHLRRHDDFTHCPDILINGRYDPDADEIEPFEEFMGSHGGLGGDQMHPFAVVPSEWSAPAGPIVGAGAMHRQLKAWLAETGQA